MSTSHLVAGIRAVEALVQSDPSRIIRIWHVGPRKAARGRVLELAEAAGIAISEMQPDRFARDLEDVRTQGVVAEVRPRPFADWRQLMANPEALIVAFDQVTDPRNFGAVLRSAEAFGATGALITQDRCARPGPAVARTSAGASELLPIAMETNLVRALRQAKEAGAWVVGADLDGVHPTAVPWTRPMVLVVGAEGEGLRRLTREACDHRVCIPLTGRTESLNASVAASILLYEATRSPAIAPTGR
jgi:23S rRNA (guanosine2251-2'-O)-methyltransferase